MAAVKTAVSPFVSAGMWIMLAGCIFLQRFTIPVGETQGIPISLLVGYAALLFILPEAYVSRPRLIGFCVTATLVVASTLVTGIDRNFSSYSMFELLISYAPFIFVVAVDEGEYKRYVNVFQLMMIVVSLVGLVQFVTQNPWDPIEEYFGQFTFKMFNTRPVIEYGSTLRRSDGLFLLEPSYLSQMCAIAITLELIYFRKRWRLALFAIGLCSSVSLSGTVMLGVFLASYAFRYRKVAHVVITAFVVAVSFWMFQDNEIIHSVLVRKDELSTQDTSGYNRFVAPFNLTAYFVNDVPTFLVGIGPGNASSTVNVNLDSTLRGGLFAPLKLLVEYGIFTTIAGMAFFGKCLFRGSRSYILSCTLFIFYTFMNGALLEPFVTFIVLALVSLYPADPEMAVTIPSVAGTRSVVRGSKFHLQCLPSSSNQAAD